MLFIFSKKGEVVLKSILLFLSLIIIIPVFFSLINASTWKHSAQADFDAAGTYANTSSNASNVLLLNQTEYHANYKDENMILWLHFNNNTYGENGSLFHDFSQYANNMSCTTCPAFTSSGKFSGAYSFDGTNDYTLMASGGTTITYFEGYTIHTFTSAGTFSVYPNNLITEVLVIGGGGGGGYDAAGGGGAGGYVYNSNYPLAANAYAVTVGAGGAGATSYGSGAAGGNSHFSTITANGGAKGASGMAAAGTGASGGGGAWGATAAGVTNSSAQGNNGGVAVNGNPYPSGGGGGSSGGGINGTGSKSGDGGAGTANSISGTAVTYAGGGGGGGTSQGAAIGIGIGGGGNGSLTGVGLVGTANTGGGAGGGTNNAAGGAGGSGIVIVRYLNNYTSSALWIKPASTNVWEFVAYNGTDYFKDGVAGTLAYYPLVNFTIGRNVTGTYFNGTIDEVAVWNRTLSADEIQDLYRLKKGTYQSAVNNTNVDTAAFKYLNFSTQENSSLDNITFQIRNCDDAICSGESFVGYDNTANTYFNTTQDSWDISFLSSNQYFQWKAWLNRGTGNPQIVNVSIGYNEVVLVVQEVQITPNSTADADPHTNLNVTASVSSVGATIDTVILQYNYTNSTGIYANATMSNNSVAIYNVSISSPVNGTLYYKIWVNDSLKKEVNGSVKSLALQHECTWEILETVPAAVAGSFGSSKDLGNITIINTGDSNYTTEGHSGCDLKFFLRHNLDSGRISFNLSGNSLAKTLSAKSNYTLNISAVFLDTATSESLIMTLSDLDSITSPDVITVNSTLNSYAGGPFFTVLINASPSAVNQTSAYNFTLSAYVKNIGNQSAENVTFNFTLPTGWSNVSGLIKLNKSLLNCSDPTISPSSGCVADTGYNTLHGIVIATVSAPLTASIGSVIVNANSSSDSKVDESCSANCSKVNSSDSATINVVCHLIGDGICPTTCSYVSTASNYDPDCTAPVGTVTTTTVGGGGGGGGGSAFRSEATYDMVRGKDTEFYLEVKNPFTDFDLTNVKVSVSGFLAQYISIEPATLDKIPSGSSFNFTIKIISPSYFTTGTHDLTFTIDSLKQKGAMKESRTERRYISLKIHELPKGDAENLISKSLSGINQIKTAGLKTAQLESLYSDAEKAFNEGDYEKVLELSTQIENLVNSGILAQNNIFSIEDKIDSAYKNKGVDAPKTERIVELAKIALEREDFVLAAERMKDAELTFALETKGEFNVVRFVMNNSFKVFIWLWIFIGLTASIFIKLKIKWIDSKLKNLSEEEEILLGLMKIVQKECFVLKKKSMGEYMEAMAQYEDKLSKTVQSVIELETEKANLLKFRMKRFEVEKKRLIELMKITQERYMKQGMIETRIYQNKMKSFNTRLTEIEEKIALKEAEKVLKKGRKNIFHSLFTSLAQLINQKKKEGIEERKKKFSEKFRRKQEDTIREKEEEREKIKKEFEKNIEKTEKLKKEREITEKEKKEVKIKTEEAKDIRKHFLDIVKKAEEKQQSKDKKDNIKTK